MPSITWVPAVVISTSSQVRGEDRAGHHRTRGVAGAEEDDVRHGRAGYLRARGAQEASGPGSPAYHRRRPSGANRMTSELAAAARSDTPTTPERTRVFPWRAVVLPWLVSRIIADGLILGMALRASRTPLYAGFAKWDGGWYLEIARHGFGSAPAGGAESPWPFFPGLPILMRAVGWLGVPEAAAGVLVNHAAFLLAVAGLYRLARRHASPTASSLAVWAVALFPGSFIFSMVYPSAIFFAASVWAFVLVEDRHDLAAGVVTIAAVMVRPNGFVVALALVVAVHASWRRVVVVCGPSALAFLGWCLYNLDRTGSTFTFWDAKAGWPEVNAIDFVNRLHKYAIPHVLLALVAIGAVVLVWRSLPRSWLVFTGLYLLPPLFVGIVGLGRYATECFPPFVAAGSILERFAVRVRVALFTLSVGLEGLCAYWVISSKWLP